MAKRMLFMGTWEEGQALAEAMLRDVERAEAATDYGLEAELLTDLYGWHLDVPYLEFIVTWENGNRERLTVSQATEWTLEYVGQDLQEGSYTFLEFQSFDTKEDMLLELEEYLRYMNNEYDIEIIKHI